MFYRLAWIVFYVFIRTVVGLLGGLRIFGRENIPRTGGLIIAPNHLSFSDPPIVEAAVRRNSWFMATDELFEKPFLGPIARLMRAYPVRQDSPDRAALRKTEDLLKQGKSVVVFPEGHVSKHGVLQPIQPGTILVALRTGVPILPVGLVNTDKLMPPHTFRFRRSPGPIVVRIGKPISAEELAGGMKGRAAVDHGAELLRRTLLDLTGQTDPGDSAPIRLEAEKQPAAQSEPAAHLHGASLPEYSRG